VDVAPPATQSVSRHVSGPLRRGPATRGPTPSGSTLAGWNACSALHWTGKVDRFACCRSYGGAPRWKTPSRMKLRWFL